MKFTTVWNIFPVLIKKSKDNWGHAIGNIVYLPISAIKGSELYQHEMFHVKQFYFFLFLMLLPLPLMLLISYWFAIITIMVLVLYNTSWLSIRREIAAYGESIRTSVKNGSNPPKGAMMYASLLHTSNKYNAGKLSLAEIEALIVKRYNDGRLF